MRVKLEIDFYADGYYTKEEELACLKTLLNDCDSAAVTLSVVSMEIVEE